MLTKSAIVTVIPAVAGQAYRAASTVCTPNAPGVPGEVYSSGSTAPASSGAGGGITPAAGTVILLEVSDGFGGYTTTPRVAPAPVGYVCRYETVFVANLADPTHTATQYNVVCTLT